jgi:hypothetical protein
MTSTYIGTLRNVERLPSSRNGNPRYAALIVTDSGAILQVRTAVDSSLGYSFTNHREGSRVRVTVSLQRGYWVIQHMEQAA